MEDKFSWYLAGFFDGEGNVSIRIKPDPRYKTGYAVKLRIELTQKNKGVLELIKKRIGMGYIYPKQKGIWSLCIWSKKDINKFVSIVYTKTFVKHKELSRLKDCLKILDAKKHLNNKGISKLQNMLQTGRESEDNTI